MDEKQINEKYNAYLSVSPKDSWVHDILCEKLPQISVFRPNVNDDHVGEVECMQKCENIIIVISKNYVNNEWSQFEIQLAYSQHLFERKPLIYITLEELTGEETNGLLQYFVECNAARIYHLVFPHPLDQDGKTESEFDTTFWNNLKNAILGRDIKLHKTFSKHQLKLPPVPSTKDYDVVISYCSGDRFWVHNTCLAMLENYYGLKVAIHYRDFPVGASITSTVFDFFQRSSSVLIILSNMFIESPWCQYEFGLARSHFRDKILIAKLDFNLASEKVGKTVTNIVNSTNDVFSFEHPNASDKLWNKIAEIIYNKNKTSGHLNSVQEKPNIACCDISTRSLVFKKNAMMLVVGSPKAGKTSLVHTIVFGSRYKSPPGSRTQLLESLIWKVSSDLGISVFDLAGNKSYSPVVPYLVNNFLNTFAIVVHNIASDDYRGTFQKMREVLLHNPYCHEVLLVLTQSDRYSVTQKLKSDKFQKEIRKYIKADKFKLEILVEKLTNQQSNQLDNVQHVIEIYKRLLQSDTDMHIISCVTQNDPGIKKLEEAMTEAGTRWARNFMPQITQKFSRKLKEFIPIVHTFVNSKDIAINLNEAETLYNNLEESSLSLQESLKILNSAGLILWYEKSPTMANMVFSHPATLIDLFRAIFQKGVSQKIDFNQLDDYEKSLFNYSKRECKKAISKLYKKGIIHINIVNVLLASVGIHEEDQSSINVLENLGLCVRISENEVFFPWYVDDYQSEITGRVSDMTNITPNHTCLHLTLKGNFSRSVFLLLCIQLVKLYKDELDWDTIPFTIWKEGMYLEKSLPLLLQCNNDQEVKILISSNISSVEEHRKMWNEVEKIKSRLTYLTIVWAPGLLITYEVDCTHCLIRMANNYKTKSSSMTQRFARRLFNTLASRTILSTVFSSSELSLLANEMHMSKSKLAPVRKVSLDEGIMTEYYGSQKRMLHCGEEEFPAGLVYPLPSSTEEAQIYLDDIQDYLKKNTYFEQREQLSLDYVPSAKLEQEQWLTTTSLHEEYDSLASISVKGRFGIIKLAENGAISFLEEQNVYVSYPSNASRHVDEIAVVLEEMPRNIEMKSINRSDVVSPVVTFLPHGSAFEDHILVVFPVKSDMIKVDETQLELMYSCTDIVEEPEWINLRQNNTPLKHKDHIFWFVNEGFCYLFTNHFCHVFLTQNSSLVKQAAIFLETSVFGKIRNGEEKVEIYVGFHCNQCFPNLAEQKNDYGKLLETRQTCIYSDEGDVNIQVKPDERDWIIKNSNPMVREAQLLLDLCKCSSIFAEKFIFRPKTCRIDQNSSLQLIANLFQGVRKPFQIEIDEHLSQFIIQEEETKPKNVSPSNSFSECKQNLRTPEEHDEENEIPEDGTSLSMSLRQSGPTCNYLNRCIQSSVKTTKTMMCNPKLENIKQEICNLLDHDPKNLLIISSEVGDQNANIDLKNMCGAVVLQLWQVKVEQNLKTWEEFYRLLNTLNMCDAATKLQELFEKNKICDELQNFDIKLEELFTYMVAQNIVGANSKEAEELLNLQKDQHERLQYLIDRILLPGPFFKLREFHKILRLHCSDDNIITKLILCAEDPQEKTKL